MAHEITKREDGSFEMAYAGEMPWHKLGTKLDQDQPSEEMIFSAKLNWCVSKMDLLIPSFIDSNGTIINDIKVNTHKAVIRNDNKNILGIVGEDYSPIQNHEMFAFFESLCSVGKLKIETAGSLFGGKRVFAIAKTDQIVKIHGTNDISENYIVIFNSHDGSLALKCFFSSIRVVCNNTLNAALKGARNAVSIRHTGDISTRISEAQTILGLNIKHQEKFSDIANHLAQKMVDKETVENFLKECFVSPNKKEKTEEDSTRTKNIIAKVKNNFENDPKNNLYGINGTAWSLLNAVTQYADHQSVSVSKSPDARMNSIMFGGGNILKQKALDLVMAI
jgi:phage/plasmid-like protein (TIGR03299 family)